MQKTAVFISLFSSMLLISCKHKTTVESGKDFATAYLNTDGLSSGFFEIDISKDTTLTTLGGMEISIPAGAFESGKGNKIKLEIKEAFTIDAIIKGGLNTTTTGGQPLSSNGMFYINVAKGETASLVKELSIRTPSSEFDPKAQLYTGENNDGKITWKDPKPVLQNGSQKEFAFGKALFSNNCASCHTIDRNLTGPALLHVTKRLPRKWLYDFTRNSSIMIHSGDCYANEVYKKWNYTAMNQFPVLDSKGMKDLYDYIDQESNGLSPATKTDTMRQMLDCLKYQRQLDSLFAKKYALVKDNGRMTNVKQVQPPDSSNLDNTGPPLKVNPANYDAVHYQFNIQALGWYNIDIELLDDNNYVTSTLQLQVQYAYEAQVNVFLVIPRKKIFQQGGKLNDETYHGFHNIDGTLPLPQNEPCIVFSVGVSQGKAIFGMLNFVSAPSQKLRLQMQAYSKTEITQKLSLLSGNGLSGEISETKNFTQIGSVDSAINALYKLREKGCDCMPEIDSTTKK